MKTNKVITDVLYVPTDKTIVDNSIITKIVPKIFYNEDDEIDLNDIDGDSGNQGNQGNSDEDSKLKEFYNSHGGEKLDDIGNLLDKEGKIVKTKEELEKIIDGNEGDNNQGNQGNEGDDNTPFIESFRKSMGYEILGQDNKPKIYEDTEEGLSQYVKDVIEKTTKEKQNNFLNSHPDLKDYAQHLMSGGKPEDYFESKYKREESGWSKLKVDDKTNEDTLYNIVKNAFQYRGFSEDRAKLMANMIKDSGSLLETAQSDIKEIALIEKQAENEKRINQQKEIENHQKEIEIYWNGIKEKVTKGVVGNIRIPEADKDAFFNYVSAAVDDFGRSQEMLDQEKAAKEGNENELLLSYLRFKKFDLKKLVELEVRNEKAKSLRDRIFRSKGGQSNGSSKGNPSYSKFGEVSIDDIL